MRELPRSVVVLALLVHALAVITATWRYLGHGFPYGDDMSSHVAEITTIARYLRNFDFDFWFSGNNLGYPMFLAYQPLPSLFGGLVVVLTPLEPETYVKGMNVLLWSLVPATWFLGARWLGMNRIGALVFGLLVTHVSDWRDFGLGVESIAYKGLFTQGFGMVLLPLAIGSFHRRVVLGEGRWSHAVGLQWLTWMSHIFFGLFGSIAGLLLVVASPSVARTKRATLLFGATALAIACWAVPMILNARYQGGLPWHNQSEDGYPWRDLVTYFREGKLFDFGRDTRALTALAVAGVLLLPFSWRTHLGRWATLLLVTSCFMLLGRTNLPSWYAAIPMHAELEVIRYLSAVQLSAILAIAIGAGGALARVPSPLLLGALGLGLLDHAVLQYRECHTVFKLFDADAPGYAGMIRALEDGPTGRYLGHKRFGSAGHFVLNLAGALSGRPHLESFGRGYHDTLSLYYVEMFDFSEAELRLYDITSVIASKGDAPAARAVLPALFQQSMMNDRYVVFDAPSWGWFDFVRTPVRVPAGDDLKVVRPEVLSLVQQLYPQRALPIFGPHVTAAGPVLSHVITESGGDNEFTATVEATGADRLLLKESYHPYWHATVDGVDEQVLQVGPNLQVVDVPEGRHEVVFHYRLPLWQKALWALTVLVLSAWTALDRR